jgi:hypothetical protein
VKELSKYGSSAGKTKRSVLELGEAIPLLFLKMLISIKNSEMAKVNERIIMVVLNLKDLSP